MSTKPVISVRPDESPASVGDYRERVLNHLEEILRSPLFGSSKRYRCLLRYVVEQTLEGRAEHLKERTIGADAFGRPVDYDTNADHSVRSAAGEVRRRLALFYADCGFEAGIRIELQPGSYAPLIRFLDVPAQLEESDHEVEPPAPPAPQAHDQALSPGSRRLWRIALALALTASVCGAISLRSYWQQRSPFDEFWGPILSSPNPVLFCAGGGGFASPAPDAVLTLGEFDRTPARRINVSDAMALLALTGALESRKKPFRILSRAGNTSFKDLQEGPFILIGAMNNEWTLRMTSGLRFTFEQTASGARISDKQNPKNTSWALDFSTPIHQPVRDYAIVTRLHDPMTDQSGIIVAGIGGWGTQAAAEFVSSPANVRKLASLRPPDWRGKNVQVVIGTDIINGSSGPAIVLGAWFW